MSIFTKSHDYIDTASPKTPQTPFASIMQLLKILAIVGPVVTLGFFLFDRVISLVEKFDGVTNHLSTLDTSVGSLNAAVSTLANTVATQATTMATHTAQLNTQTESLGRIENALGRWNGPSREAYAQPTFPHPEFTRHPCDKPSKPRERC